MINQARTSTHRSRRRFGAGLVATTLAAVGLPLVATSAWAVGINNPPVLPHTIISFPARDFISADGYTPGALTTVNVLRGGLVIGTAQTPADSTGLVEINHPGGGCWTGVTPDIQAGDVVQVLTGPGTGDATRTAGITVTQNAAVTTPGTVTIHGNAVSATGVGRIPIDQIEARIVNQAFVANGLRRTIRADFTGSADGTLAYDGAGPSWTATFSGLSAVNAANAVAGESRGLWLGATPGSGQELTIYESGGDAPAVNGPAAPCGGPVAPAPSIPDMTPATDLGISALDNLTANARPTFTGVTGDLTATSATLFVDDQVNATAAIVPGSSKYSVAPTAALTNGRHTVRVMVTAPAAPDALSPGFLSISIDSVRPVVTTRTPGVNATKVVQVGNLSATFGEKVFGVTNATFALKNTLTNAGVGAAATYNATTRVAVLNPTATLAAGTRYTATLTSGIKDLAGNSITATSWSFTTGPRPTVISKSPAANALGVSRVANATATFSENVGGVSRSTFKLKRTSTGAAVTVVVSYNSITHVATMNPSATLAASTKYTATLAPAAAATLPHIKDAEGNTLATLSWSFTTRR